MDRYREAWQEVDARCEGCAVLLGHLVHGWGLPSEDGLAGEAWAAERARREYLRTRALAGRRPTVEEDGEERPLRVEDDRETWKRAGVPEHALEDRFTDRGPGRPRLHRWLTPDALDDVLTSLEGALEHLEDVAVDDLPAHFEAVYGRPWPPHLEDVIDTLRERWHRDGRDLSPGRRAYERRATARRVALALPIECSITRAAASHIHVAPPEGSRRGLPSARGKGVMQVAGVGRRTALVDVSYRPCPWEYEQIRKLDPN